MGEIHVQFESLQAGQQGIQNNYAKLTATLEQLESDLQPMIGSWSGAAQESYLACKKQWDDAAVALSQVLRSVGEAVGEAHENCTAAESGGQAKRAWAVDIIVFQTRPGIENGTSRRQKRCHAERRKLRAASSRLPGTVRSDW